MSVSIFNDKTVMPNNSMVVAALVDTYALWVRLQNYVKSEYPNVIEEWKHYGKASGWCLKLISKKRNLLFFIPLNGCFRIRIVLGEKAVACLEAIKLSNEIKKAIYAATSYVEGRSIEIDVTCCEQIETIKSLLDIKFAK